MDPRVTAYLSHPAGFPIGTAVENVPGGGQIFAAWLIDFPGCIGQGSTEREARERLMAVAPVFVERMLALGVEIPSEPPSIISGTIQVYDPDLFETLSGTPDQHGGTLREPKVESGTDDSEIV